MTDDITYCIADCEMACWRKPKHIKNKKIPHSFADYSGICNGYRPIKEPTQTNTLKALGRGADDE